MHILFVIATLLLGLLFTEIVIQVHNDRFVAWYCSIIAAKNWKHLKTIVRLVIMRTKMALYVLMGEHVCAVLLSEKSTLTYLNMLCDPAFFKNNVYICFLF